MDNTELRYKKQWYEQQLAKISEVVEGWNTAVDEGITDSLSSDPERRAFAWSPTAAEKDKIHEFAQTGKKFLKELKAVESALGIVRIPKPPAQ
jgi:hypothetical protein